MRIDDVDQTRARPGATERILRCLETFRLQWDGVPVLQSQRNSEYQSAINTLTAADALYRCGCSRSSIAGRAGTTGGGAAVYPGTCRLSPSPANRPHAIRIKVPDAVIAVPDQIQGIYQQNLARVVGDFPVKRKDGLFAYHLATVIDDAELGVTHVVRGADLLESTPRQIFLQSSLGLPTPLYAHLPVLVDRMGNKLSKQTGATAVEHREPSPILHRLLKLMGQQPPAELAEAGVPELIAWAKANWDIRPMLGVAAIRLDRD